MTNPVEPTVEADFTFAKDRPFQLDSGAQLGPVTLHYTMYGRLNEQRDNAILACHALSGSANVGDWWAGMFGPNKPFDTSQFCIIGCNVLGSCYGSTGPTSDNPKTGRHYGPSFPIVSIADMVRGQAALADHLGIQRFHTVIGGSIGGMQSLAWATMYPDRLARCVAIGSVPLSAMGLALNHLQRQAICNDPDWRNGHYAHGQQPRKGLALARAIAMCSYKSAALFDQRYARKPNRGEERPTHSMTDRYDIAGYLDYQGELFFTRFDANSYLTISKAMDNFDLGADSATRAEILRRIQARVLLVGITSDWLFPVSDVCDLHNRMRNQGIDCHYQLLASDHGHDAFLADVDLLLPLVTPFLREGIPVGRWS